jgi:hypothetical protein
LKGVAAVARNTPFDLSITKAPTVRVIVTSRLSNFSITLFAYSRDETAIG